MDGLGIDYNLLANMGGQYQKGQEFGMNKAMMPLRVGLMGQEFQKGQQELQTGQITLEEKQKLAQFGNELSEWAKANPDKNVWDFAPQLAMKYGLSTQALGFLKANADQLNQELQGAIGALKLGGKQGAFDYYNKSKLLKQAFSLPTINDIPGGGWKIETKESASGNKYDFMVDNEGNMKPLTPQAPRAMNEVEILSLPEDDPKKQAYMKSKKEISTKDPYFQAVGIIEETNELIGYDARTFETKRVKISGMPIKPGTVKSTDPIKQAIADALKETKGKVSTESKTPQGKKTVEQTITDLKTQGTTPQKIIELMSEAGVDPDPYMDLINK